MAMPDLLRMFGKHMFKRFSALYPSHFDGHSTAFAFLSTLDSKIHVEVKKLYPDAELPAFAHDLSSPGRMILVYRSKRPFADLAEGLLRGCVDHFNEPVHVTREDLPCTDGAHTRFTLTR